MSQTKIDHNAPSWVGLRAVAKAAQSNSQSSPSSRPVSPGRWATRVSCTLRHRSRSHARAAKAAPGGHGSLRKKWPRGPLQQVPLKLEVRPPEPLAVGLHHEDAAHRAQTLRHPPRESPQGLDREGGGWVRAAVGSWPCRPPGNKPPAKFSHTDRLNAGSAGHRPPGSALRPPGAAQTPPASAPR